MVFEDELNDYYSIFESFDNGDKVNILILDKYLRS